VERCRFEIEVPAPFRLDFTVWTLRRRAHNAVDRWNGACYRRTMVTRGGEAVEVVVRQEPDPERSRLAVELRGSGAKSPELAEPEIRRLLDRTLGLSVDLGGFYHLTERCTSHDIGATVRRDAAAALSEHLRSGGERHRLSAALARRRGSSPQPAGPTVRTNR
jgi:hypothetical protein